MIAIAVEFFAYLRARKKLWLMPLFITLLLIGGLLALAEGTAIAPFIYTIF